MTAYLIRLVLFLVIAVPLSSIHTSCGGPGGTVACDPLGDQSDADFSGETSVASLEIPEGTTKTIAGGSVITVTGDETIDGTLEVLPGGATIIFQGALTWNGSLNGSNTDTSCVPALKTQETSEEEKEPDDIILVLLGNTTFGEKFKLETDTSVKITDDLGMLPSNDQLDTEATTDDGTGNVLAPFPDTSGSALVVQNSAAAGASKSLVIGNTWIFGGTHTYMTPPPGTRRIIVAIQPFGTTDVDMGGLFPLTITGPDGRDGEDQTKTGTCTGKKGGDAMTFVANIVGDLTVSDFTLNLGNGGKGGDCTAEGDPNATATGGEGGKNGAMKMRTTGSFDITGSFNLNPGQGGNGGAAIANAKDGADGCPPIDGGTATATGGMGADKKKALTARNVGGVGNVTIGPINAGNGGNATANAGNGGDNTCPCPPPGDGADAGDGTATGGKGGNASLPASGAASGAVTGGNGGDADANNGIGGDGNDCGKLPGGNGGMGGDMTANGGDGGTGTTASGTDGMGSLGADAGKGGNGGDGIPPGAGGPGGTCTIDGSSSSCPDGEDGTLRSDLITLLCINLPSGFPEGGNPGCAPISTLDPREVNLTNVGGSTTLGTIDIDASGNNSLCKGNNPTNHIGIQPGSTIDIELVSMSLVSTTPVTVSGIRIDGFVQGNPGDYCQGLKVTPQGGNPQSHEIVPDSNNNYSIDSFFESGTTVARVTVEGLGDPTCLVFWTNIYIIDP